MLRKLLKSIRSNNAVAYDQDPAGNTIVPLLSGKDLLADRNRQVYVSRIALLVSVPQPHFEKLYIATLENFADYVQQLPASEAHHHASLGGLLNHSLEVAEKALALRRGYLLPPDSDPEVVSRQADLWTYAVFASALCHDIGKAVVDQEVHLFDSAASSLGTWNPWLGPMRSAHYYRVTFVRGRQYGRHELVGPFVARTILPDAALQWLGQERDVTTALVASLSGAMDKAGALGTIVSQADSLSTSENLGAGDTRLPSATTIPLHEKLLTGLRALLEDGSLNLNRPGAAAFMTESDLWLVSKRVLDLLKSYLTEQGHTGVPSKNDRLMDELQQFGICVPNGERAIWRATVALPDWEQELSLLRVKTALIWPDASARPSVLDGTVTYSETPASNSEPDASQPAVSASKEAVPDHNASHVPLAASPDVPALPDLVLPPVTDPEIVEELDANNRTTTVNASEPDAPEVDNDNTVPNTEPDGFLAWLREGIQSGTFEINTRDALFHVVPEGLLMVSPLVFKKYAGQTHDWSKVQAKFFKSRLHRRTAERTNIIRYKIQGKRRAAVIKGVLVPNPKQGLGVDLPMGPNSHLELETQL